MEDAKLIDTPKPIHRKFEKNENGKDVDIKKYRGIIGYLTAFRPNIMFSVCMCAHYESDLKEPHLKSINCILRYLNDTFKYELWYSKRSDCTLAGYTCRTPSFSHPSYVF